MSDKSHTMPDGLFALSHHGLMTLAGRDAVAFAQAQFMNGVTLLPDGQWQWNGWLTPKGRVIALFALLRVNAETLWVVVPDTDPGPLADALRRYVFRSKVAIAVREDLHVAGRFGAPLAASGAIAAVAEAAGANGPAHVELDMGGTDGSRALYVLAHGQARSATQEEAWTAADLRHGLPRLPREQAEHWTPQQLSLERLKAFSVKKGCYPGQEIVARTHFLGKAKRGLVLVTGPEPIQPGRDLHAGGAVLGTVISAGTADHHHLALAVVPLDRNPDAALTLNDVPVQELPLLEGLAR